MAAPPKPPVPFGLALARPTLATPRDAHDRLTLDAIRAIAATAGGELREAQVLLEREIPTAADSPPSLRVVSPRAAEHKPVRGWLVIRRRANALVYELAPASPDRDPYAIRLQATAAITADLLVW